MSFVYGFGDDWHDPYFWDDPGFWPESSLNCMVHTFQGEAVDLAWFEFKVDVDEMLDLLSDYFFDDGLGAQILVKYPNGRVVAVWEHQLRNLLKAIN